MKQKILFIVSLVFGVMFVNSGLNVFFNYMPAPPDMPADTIQMFAGILQVVWLMPLIGVVQVLGGALFIIPRFRALGAVIISPVMVGIILTHLTVASEGLPIALPLFAILIWVIIENRKKYLPMIK